MELLLRYLSCHCWATLPLVMLQMWRKDLALFTTVDPGTGSGWRSHVNLHIVIGRAVALDLHTCLYSLTDCLPLRMSSSVLLQIPLPFCTSVRACSKFLLYSHTKISPSIKFSFHTKANAFSLPLGEQEGPPLPLNTFNIQTTTRPLMCPHERFRLSGR